MIGNSDNKDSHVTVKREALLEALKKNFDEHRGTFLKALDGYRAQVIVELERILTNARDKGKAIGAIHVLLPVPEDHTRDYDRVIRMLDMTVKDEIIISEREFGQYVMDDWGWKGDFTSSVSNYVGR